MKIRFLSSFFAALVLSTQAIMAQDARPDCAVAGPDAYFCQGDAFSRLEIDRGEGVSFWVHKAGYLSKVLVEDTGGKDVTQGQIERRILALVTAQADSFGRDFRFSDLTATTIHGVPFGTFSYRLRGAKHDSAVLHSYVAIKGRVLQVVSQILLDSASRDAEALEKAHADALKAVRVEELSSDA